MHSLKMVHQMLRGDDSFCRRDGFPRSYQHTPAGNRTTAQGGYPGLRVIAGVLLPKALRASVDLLDVRSPITVAGAAAVSHRVPI